MANDVLTAVPLFLFMGYIVERANIVDRLFFTLQIAARRIPGSMAVAAWKAWVAAAAADSGMEKSWYCWVIDGSSAAGDVAGERRGPRR